MADTARSTPATELPVLPLRDVVVFPTMVVPLFVGREKSMRALDRAMQGDKQILLVAQRSPDIDDPAGEDLHPFGTLANVLQLLRLPDGTVKVLVEGQRRARVGSLAERDGVLVAEAEPVAEPSSSATREVEAAAKSLLAVFEQYAKVNRKVPPELLATLAGIDDPSRLADTVASHLGIRLADKQRVLETVPVGERLELLIGFVDGEIDVQQLEKRIRGRVKSQMEKSQREYYLNEQMKAIQKELGELDEAPSEMDELERKIEKAGMPKAVETKARAELNKLKQMSPMSAEATVVRNYIDWLVQVPWQARTEIRQDLGEAEQVLDADHYGLEEVKQRILEYLAVQQRVQQLKGPILCLVGPPGVGKTSLGQSIAKATGRKFIRMALGGVRDEAEIRGHRRTYIGSMPGRIIQNLVKAGSRNALVMLDEIDKMSMDFRGDPSAALLEVLDPEQNHTFNDHYLEVDFDLSEVMFVATANSLNIPGPLLDRMEVIRIPGYTEDEKINIGERYLLPKQMRNNGLREGELSVSEDALRDIVRYYTRESGVRAFEREIAKVCRKVVKENTLAESKAASAAVVEAEATAARGKGTKRRRRKAEPELRPVGVDRESLAQYLGVRKYNYGLAEDQNEVGVVTGLAWTQVGGDLLSIEATVIPGKGKLIHTGQLGDVMQESIQAALSVVRSRAVSLGIDPEFHQKWDIHIHVPEGATPKDGPSAGIAMATALVSALTKVPVRADVAMTGEITLRGRVLPIGGLKEKLLAAHRGGIKLVLIPEENRKDLAEIPKNVTDSLEIRPVKWIDEVLHLALAGEAPAVATVEPVVTTPVAAVAAEEVLQDGGAAKRAH
jgi:ATP-dependent Lon protease